MDIRVARWNTCPPLGRRHLVRSFVAELHFLDRSMRPVSRERKRERARRGPARCTLLRHRPPTTKDDFFLTARHDASRGGLASSRPSLGVEIELCGKARVGPIYRFRRHVRSLNSRHAAIGARAVEPSSRGLTWITADIGTLIANADVTRENPRGRTVVPPRSRPRSSPLKTAGFVARGPPSLASPIIVSPAVERRSRVEFQMPSVHRARPPGSAANRENSITPLGNDSGPPYSATASRARNHSFGA